MGRREWLVCMWLPTIHHGSKGRCLSRIAAMGWHYWPCHFSAGLYGVCIVPECLKTMSRAGLGRVVWGGCVLSLTVDHALCRSWQGGMGGVCCLWLLTMPHADLGRVVWGDNGFIWALFGSVVLFLGERCRDNYCFLVLYQTRRHRSIQSNREKRKRYRANRKLRKTY